VTDANMGSQTPSTLNLKANARTVVMSSLTILRKASRWALCVEPQGDPRALRHNMPGVDPQFGHATSSAQASVRIQSHCRRLLGFVQNGTNATQ
jgi:hypothetical protein